MLKTIGRQRDIYEWIVYGYIFLLLCCVTFSISTELYWLWLLPAVVIGIGLTFYNYTWLYYSFFILIPFSIEIRLPSGLGTDLPTEPIMILLTGLALVLGLYKIDKLDLRYLKHPITVLLLLHVFWILFTAMLSQNPLVSYKFFLAKLWYVTPFYFLSLYLLKDRQIIVRSWWMLSISLVLSVAFILLKFYPLDFKFKHIESIMGPFFRNHVNYASIMAISMPYMWALWKLSKGSAKKWMLAFMLFMIVSLYFSYTRAAMLAVFMSTGVFYIIKYRLMKITIIASLFVGVIGTGALLKENNWLNFSPNYEKTISHKSFDDLISATYKMEDISTMERVYRWVAAGHMIGVRPITGFGPGTFIFFYKSYTVTSFETYVSDNPENSGIHSYYLMTWVDQGTIGLVIFILLTIFTLIYGERVYHRVYNENDRIILIAALLSIFIIDAILLINDMLEVDKTGPFYFISLAILVSIDLRREEKLEL
jgi:O-antigen ligase